MNDNDQILGYHIENIPYLWIPSQNIRLYIISNKVTFNNMGICVPYSHEHMSYVIHTQKDICNTFFQRFHDYPRVDYYKRINGQNIDKINSINLSGNIKIINTKKDPIKIIIPEYNDKFILAKILLFPPKKNMYKLMLENECVYSVTPYKDAQYISDMIIKHINKDPKDIVITDATSNCGGNTINFAQNFKKVFAVEINPQIYKSLLNNINFYNITNVTTYNNDYLNLFNQFNQDVIFIDPPWGGPDYKNKIKLRLTLGKYSLYKLLDVIQTTFNYPLIVLKLPKNYDYQEFDHFQYVYYDIYKPDGRINYYIYLFNPQN